MKPSKISGTVKSEVNGTVDNPAPSGRSEVARTTEAVTNAQTSKAQYLHALPLPHNDPARRSHSTNPNLQNWCVVTSDEPDAVTINARIIAQGLIQENAELIAKAVNCHDALVEACKLARLHLESYLDHLTDGPGITCLKMLEVAIKKATQ